MKKMVILGLVLMILAFYGSYTRLALSQEGWELNPEDSSKRAREECLDTKELLDDITLLNLVDGLNFTEEQLKSLIDCAKEAREIRQRYFEENCKEIEKFEEVLTELKETLIINQGIPKALEQRVKEKKVEIKLEREEYFEQLKALEKKIVQEILSDAQKMVIDEFNPCVIPPDNLKNPVRVGQQTNNLAEIEKGLTDMRAMPEKQFNSLINYFIEQIITQFDFHLGELSEEEREVEKERLLNIIKKARAMGDAEYELNKPQLAQEIVHRLDEFIQSANKLTKLFSLFGSGMTKAGKYLLNPRIIPILKKRLELKNAPLPPQQDLDKISIKGQDKPETVASQDSCLKGKPSFEEFAEFLGLAEEQSNKIKPVIQDGQLELFQIVSKPREDGINMLKEITKLEKSQMSQKEKETRFFALCYLEIPGTKETYLERIMQIKSRIEKELKGTFSKAQFKKYRLKNIDLFKIQI